MRNYIPPKFSWICVRCHYTLTSITVFTYRRTPTYQTNIRICTTKKQSKSFCWGPTIGNTSEGLEEFHSCCNKTAHHFSIVQRKYQFRYHVKESFSSHCNCSRTNPQRSETTLYFLTRWFRDLKLLMILWYHKNHKSILMALYFASCVVTMELIIANHSTDLQPGHEYVIASVVSCGHQFFHAEFNCLSIT